MLSRVSFSGTAGNPEAPKSSLSLPKTPSALNPQRLTNFDPSETLDYDNVRASPNRRDRMSIIRTVVIVLRAFLTPRGNIIAENLVLRHQIGLLQRAAKRPALRQSDRILWVWLSRLWPDWRSCLLIVQPAPSFAGIDKVSSSIGAGSLARKPGAQESRQRSAH